MGLAGVESDIIQPYQSSGSMNALIIMGGLLTLISAPQLLPWFRRRAKQRGLSGGIAIPRFLTMAGVLVILIGLAIDPHL